MSLRPPLLLTGGGGLVATALYCRALRSYRCTLAVRRSRPGSRLRRGDRLENLDLARPGAAAALAAGLDPEVILHCGAISSLTECARDPARAARVNVASTRELAEYAAASGAYLVFFSSDQVFDGESAPYRETDPPAPLGVYGTTKWQAERAVLECCPDALILRLALVLGSVPGRPGGALAMLRPPDHGEHRVTLYVDEWRTPLSAACLARVVEAVLRSRPGGILHVGGPERCNRVELGRRIVAAFGWNRTCIEEGCREDSPLPRPRDLSLDLTRLRAEGLPVPRPLDAALEELREEPGVPREPGR